MTGESRVDILIMFLGVCLLLMFTGILVIKFIMSVYLPFTEERNFIQREIMRTQGNEQVHWRHELKRLYISQIPLIGVYLAESSRKRGKKK